MRIRNIYLGLKKNTGGISSTTRTTTTTGHSTVHLTNLSTGTKEPIVNKPVGDTTLVPLNTNSSYKI